MKIKLFWAQSSWKYRQPAGPCNFHKVADPGSLQEVWPSHRRRPSKQNKSFMPENCTSNWERQEDVCQHAPSVPMLPMLGSFLSLQSPLPHTLWAQPRCYKSLTLEAVAPLLTRSGLWALVSPRLSVLISNGLLQGERGSPLILLCVPFTVSLSWVWFGLAEQMFVEMIYGLH